MTVLDEVLISDERPVGDARGRAWPRFVMAFVAGVILCLALGAAALYAWDASYEGRVLPGVRVGAVELSGLDRSAAAAALSAAFDAVDDGRIVLRTDAGEAAVSFSAFSRRVDVDAMVDAALRTGRNGTVVERAIGEVRLALRGESLAPAVVFDEAALEAAISRSLARFERRPIDSRIWIDGEGIHRTLARPGRTIDAGGAVIAAREAVGRLDAPREIVLTVPTTTVPPTRGDEAALAAQKAAERMVADLALTDGEQRWAIRARMIRSWLRMGVGPDGEPWPTVDAVAIAASFNKITKDVKQPAVSARYLKTRAGRIVGVVAGRNGTKLDAAATAAAIAAALDTRARGSSVPPVEVVLAKVEPKLTTAEALKHGPQMVRLGGWRTYFPISDRNYWGANIWRPAEIIDGMVLMPGQRFEWWSAIGPVSPATGYGPGGFIAGNRTEPTGALGGGMCSSSTTLFNAALRAGLDMGARSNHRYYIDRYPLGLDATVSKTRNGVQTMSFTNDMRHPIVIRTFRTRAGGRGWVRYEIWGVPDGRTVSLSKPAVSNVRQATTKTVFVSTLPKGRREQVEYPSNGMTVSVTRVVRTSGGRVLHRDTYRTNYALWHGIVNVGR